MAETTLAIHPVTPERWADLVALFGPNGACSGCWCTYWRLKRSDFSQTTSAGRRQMLEASVNAGQVPGLLAYVAGQPAGWCAIGPRALFPALDRSWLLKPVDDQPVWSVVCFFIGRPYRRQGLTVALLQAAIAHAQRGGARIVEGYPVDPANGQANDLSAYTGLVAAFRAVGFVEVLRRKATRPIMRYGIPEE